jgi:allantoinase
MIQAVASNRVVTAAGLQATAVVIGNGRIHDICPVTEIPRETVLHDYGDLLILPGLVDTHVHINEPGRTEWEGFTTATRAAAAGGYTTLVDMPLNCLPETTSVAALEAKRQAAAGKCLVDWAAWGGLTGQNREHIGPLADARVAGYKCFLVHPGIEGFTMIEEQQLEAALPDLTRTGLPLLVHAELQNGMGQPAPDADFRQYSTYLHSRPDEAELAAIRMLIRLCRKYKFPLHIVHLSTSLALRELAQAREEGLPITVETCPHYLHFAAEEIPDGATLFKCAPPIRSRDNREALWQGLRDGVIDFVVTDHSPCPPAMKRLDEGDFQTAWGGITSLSFAISVLWTEMWKRNLPVEDLARWMSSQPAKLAGISHRKGAIAVGQDADLVVFDPDGEFVLTGERLHYRHLISPYVGEQLRGSVEATFLRGMIVFDGDRFIGEPMGTEIRRERLVASA